jgi:hypothetical protein
MIRWKIAVFALLTSTMALAQMPTESALQVREQLQSLMRNSPPQVGRVLRLDPTLISNESYMGTYPALNAYVKQHPEIQHNPAYFLGDPEAEVEGGYRVWRELMSDIGGFFAFLVVTFVLVWMVRTLIAQRRWNRLSAIQTEVHSKLLDRFTSNDELLAYLQSPAGSKFLQSAPIPLEAGPRPMNAPLGRIFWSLQSGLVALALGGGFMVLSQRVGPGAAAWYGAGVIALFIGIAMMLSAAIFYFLSRRFGLWQASVS